MAQAGYRTLCVAEKVLPDAAYEKWAEQYRAACVALQVRGAVTPVQEARALVTVSNNALPSGS